jgi:hypothetical protein
MWTDDLGEFIVRGVCLVAGQPGQGRPLTFPLVPPILRDNWGQHWDSPVLILNPEPNNLI